MSKFCSTCSSLSISQETLLEPQGHQLPGLRSTLSQLIDTATSTAIRKGCPLCILFLDSLDLTTIEKTDHLSDVIRVDLHRGKSKRFTIQCGFKFGRPLPISFCDIEDVSDAEPGLSADSPEVFATIEYWMQECAKHKLCHSSLSSRPPESWLPTRLIAVGSEDRSVRLCETSGHVGKYITLSHRWTSSTAASSTTLQNIHQRMESIEVSELSQTFQDAIHVTRRLGVPYIWIDSLSIIQDSEEDWKRESQNMMSIYELAWLNLSAAGCEGPDGRLFMPRNSIVHKPLKLPAGLHSIGIDTDAPKETHQRPWVYIPSDISAQQVLNSFLDCRGWILQERVLSKRTVYFGQNEIVWECSSSIASERCPWGFEQDCSITNLKLDSQQGAPRLDRSSTEEVICSPLVKEYWPHVSPTHKPVYEYWRKIVERYSAKSLTNISDKLPAILGLAQALHKSRLPGVAFNDAYHLGMWRTDYIASLCWYSTTRDSEEVPGVASYSWASCSGAIRFSSSDLDIRGYNTKFYNLDAVEGLQNTSPVANTVSRVPYAIPSNRLRVLGKTNYGSLTNTGTSLQWTLTIHRSYDTGKKELASRVYIDEFRNGGEQANAYGLYLTGMGVSEGVLNVECLDLGWGVSKGNPWLEVSVGLVIVRSSQEGYARVGMYEIPRNVYVELETGWPRRLDLY